MYTLWSWADPLDWGLPWWRDRFICILLNIWGGQSSGILVSWYFQGFFEYIFPSLFLYRQEVSLVRSIVVVLMLYIISISISLYLKIFFCHCQRSISFEEERHVNGQASSLLVLCYYIRSVGLNFLYRFENCQSQTIVA